MEAQVAAILANTTLSKPRFRHLKVRIAPLQTEIVGSPNEIFYLLDADSGLIVSSDSGICDRSGTGILQEEHLGPVTVENNTSQLLTAEFLVARAS